MRIAHIVCSTAFAGVERYVLTAAVQQARAGCEVTVIGGPPDVFLNTLRSEGVRWMPGTRAASAWRSLRRLRALDIVNTHMTDADLVGAIGGTRHALVSTRHFAAQRGSSALRRLITEPLSTRFDAQIAISQFVADHIEGESVVIHTGVSDVETPDTLRQPVVLVAQRLEKEKGCEDALRTWAACRPVTTRWRLRVAGDGGERERLEDLAAELGIAPTVDFLGFVGDMSEQYKEASVLLAPTPREGLGLSVIEAMSFGLPVVASDAGGHRETVGGVGGARLYAVGDISAAARQLQDLMSDPLARERYGAELRRFQSEHFTLERQTAETLALYRDVMAR